MVGFRKRQRGENFNDFFTLDPTPPTCLEMSIDLFTPGGAEHVEEMQPDLFFCDVGIVGGAGRPLARVGMAARRMIAVNGHVFSVQEIDRHCR
jgi:hypothetical protein